MPDEQYHGLATVGTLRKVIFCFNGRIFRRRFWAKETAIFLQKKMIPPESATCTSVALVKSEERNPFRAPKLFS